MTRLAAAALLAVLAAPVVALAGDGIAVSVQVGKTVEANVASAKGWFCDDPSLVHADVVTRGDHNVWIVTGAKAGHTQCRVGTDPYLPHYVFDLTVVPAKHR